MKKIITAWIGSEEDINEIFEINSFGFIEINQEFAPAISKKVLEDNAGDYQGNPIKIIITIERKDK